MTSPRQEQRAHRLMQALLDCPNAQQRSALFLDLLVAEGLTESAAIWRRLGRGPVRAWHPILARGPASLLPTLEMVRGVARGELPNELSGGRAVLLPINHRRFALAIGQGHGPRADVDEDLDTIDALFHVWMAVEVAESVEQSDELLEALPALGASDSSAAPLARPSNAPEALMAWHGWERFLAREAERCLAPEVALELECDVLPEGRFDEQALRSILSDLMTHAAAGNARAPQRVRVRLEHLQGECIRATFEDDGGAPPSLRATTRGRFGTGLFDASKVLHAAGGDMAFKARSGHEFSVSATLPVSN